MTVGAYRVDSAACQAYEKPSNDALTPNTEEQTQINFSDNHQEAMEARADLPQKPRGFAIAFNLITDFVFGQVLLISSMKIMLVFLIGLVWTHISFDFFLS